jgi:hypothetical protein
MLVAAFQFLSGACGQAIGVELVAYQTGSGGTGMNYVEYNSAHPGPNAFAVFKFASASNPFYVLLQSNEYGSTFGAAPGNPGFVRTDANRPNFAFSVAAMEDGSSPWRGTTLKNGNDRKGSPVWHTQSYCFPRSNSAGGANAAVRDSMMTSKPEHFYPTEGINWYLAGASFHFLADENNFLFANGLHSGRRTHYVSWVGRYFPTAQHNSPVKLACINHQGYADLPIPSGQNFGYDQGHYGGPTGYGSFTSADGGVTFKSGSTGLVTSLTVDWYMGPVWSPLNPSSYIGGTTSYYTPGNLFAVANESPYFGLLGTLDFIRLGQNYPSTTLLGDGNFAYMHNGSPNTGNSYQNYTGLVVPWSPTAAAPGISCRGVRGQQFIKQM